MDQKEGVRRKGTGLCPRRDGERCHEIMVALGGRMERRIEGCEDDGWEALEGTGMI